MRRISTVVATALLLVGAVGASTPARAQVPDCELGDPPPLTTIERGPGFVTVHPTNAPADALAVSGWLLRYVDCLEGGLVAEAIQCVTNNLPTDPIVTVDPETLDVTIHYGNILPQGEEFCDG